MGLENIIPVNTQQQIDNIAAACGRIKPLVAIYSITYNHGRYIRNALDGFISQQTTFPFVAIVHDDCSNDNTADILREYADRYPDLIFPIFEIENQYSKDNNRVDQIMTEAIASTGASYIAMCEGDDYWINSSKLQKQVDFLESNPDFSLCFHNAMVHYEKQDKEDRPFANINSREYLMRENVDGWIIATASSVYRSTVYNSTSYKEFLKSRKFVVTDLPIFMSCFKTGKVFGMEDIMSVYRLQASGWTQQDNLSSKLAVGLIEQEIELRRIFGGYFNEVYKKRIAKHSRAATSLLLKGNFKKSFQVWRMALKYAPWESIVANIKFFFKMIKNKTAQSK